ncbi:unnamed protein product [Paramecium primaurelia]|uniref:Transmembrane protein n=1 Tax=Paramecium primaurelia TaxID=5886 RepID=A0A8S1NQS9_PARPR|nr:unnamed protein product [Paramecium primaurelia]
MIYCCYSFLIVFIRHNVAQYFNKFELNTYIVNIFLLFIILFHKLSSKDKYAFANYQKQLQIRNIVLGEQEKQFMQIFQFHPTETIFYVNIIILL